MNLEERLWSRVVKQNDGCWIFTGSRQGAGYGQMSATELGLGRCVTTHRIAWILTHGEIPKGMFVCHACDVRACCNPEHLFLGTAGDNNRDMAAKGRAYRPTWRGLQVPGARFSDAQVAEIRRRRATGEKLKSIASTFGCTEAYVSAVALGRTRT